LERPAVEGGNGSVAPAFHQGSLRSREHLGHVGVDILGRGEVAHSAGEVRVVLLPAAVDDRRTTRPRPAVARHQQLQLEDLPRRGTPAQTLHKVAVRLRPIERMARIELPFQANETAHGPPIHPIQLMNGHDPIVAVSSGACQPRRGGSTPVKDFSRGTSTGPAYRSNSNGSNWNGIPTETGRNTWEPWHDVRR
jgi:hypothetical protein